jgi:hypothetical protein
MNQWDARPKNPFSVERAGAKRFDMALFFRYEANVLPFHLLSVIHDSTL